MIRGKKLIWGEDGNGSKEEKKAENNSPSNDSSTIDAINDHIYFYSYVDENSILQLNKKLRELDDKLSTEAYKQKREPSPITLHINSCGGSILDGIAGMESILQTNAPVITIVDGGCASAATFLSVVGESRKIGRYSFMLIHQLSAITWGKYRELRDEQINFDRFMKMIKDIYFKYTKIPEQEIDEILDHDLWFDAEKCLEYNLVDEIL